MRSTLMELLSNVHLRAESNLGLQQDEQKECLSFSGLHCGSCVCTVSAVCTSSTWELLGELVPLQRRKGCGEGLCIHSSGSCELKRFQQQEMEPK